ncbi:hypothetical protein AUJ68_04735 [Candidatus Woesearchaeota archaeon CG1_02_57_44]|nr:MAG: hypothetical protein AUJ68_04735 [Candidatus Woesearchaeota archaeon CG1_02_57_44]PIN68256.1 MAG: hypothetical protein COV94_05700 [Candidatus Woesearchaeota archaeon CG11_big_fil_rev_8_21_14_0_20_57_5]
MPASRRQGSLFYVGLLFIMVLCVIGYFAGAAAFTGFAVKVNDMFDPTVFNAVDQYLNETNTTQCQNCTMRDTLRDYKNSDTADWLS